MTVRPTFYRVNMSEILLITLPILALIAFAYWLKFQFVRPAPPQRITITTGGEAGAYHTFAKRYAQILARSNITLDLRPSAGAIENLARIRDEKTNTDLALLQGGIATAKDAPELMSIGRLFFEPLWVFYRGTETLDRLTQLKGKRLAVGPEGSGTRHLVTNLLAHNGITKDTATLLPLSGQAAVSALEKGEIDAIFLDFSPEAPIIQGLFRNPDVRIMSFTQADAYTRRFPYLSKLVLPQGGVDLERNIPPTDVLLLGTAAALVARKDLHPSLVFLLSQAVAEVHSGQGLFQQAGDFPKATDPEFPMSDTAVRFYKNGPPFFQRFLPFWVANLVEQLVVLALPILTVAFPVFKLAPVLYRWRARRHILYWYGQLKKVEASLDAEPTAGQTAMLRAEIDRIEDDVNSSSVPLGSADQFYILRGHIDLVRQRLGLPRGIAVATS